MRSCTTHGARCWWLALALAPGLLACTEDLPPYGEVVVVVDTDLAARFTDQLRVDVYSADGRWLDSREVARLDTRDWPASFSLQAPTERPATDILLRLRGYPTGSLRDYRGERFAPRPIFEPTFVPSSMAEACADPPELKLGSTRWVKGGRTAFTEVLGGDPYCEWFPTEAGAAILQVEIPTAGTYRFAALATQPPGDVQVSLQVRSDCLDDASFLGCDAGVIEGGGPLGYLPTLDVELAAGTYFVFATNGGTEIGTSLVPWEAQVAAAPVDAWDELSPPDDDAPWSWTITEPAPPTSRLELEGSDTPSTEPQPEVTVDRLLHLQLTYGEKRAAHVTLHGACVGTMARLRADTSQPEPLIAEAESCVDQENERVALTPHPLVEDLTVPTTSSTVGTFPESEPCQVGQSSDDVVCVPGGMFVLGARVGSLAYEWPLTALPEKPAIMSRFWIDRREVTVERWRQALEQGFEPPSAEDAPYANDKPYAATDDTAELIDTEEGTDDRATLCTYSSQPLGREDWPVNCVSWYAARAFCQFSGGDLPSEAQWEYVATAAGRGTETFFPWGNERPVCSPADCAAGDEGCHAAVLQRSKLIPGDCQDGGFGPTAVQAYEDDEHGDVTVPLYEGDLFATVFGLAGGMSEFTLDSLHPYSAPCWRSTPLADPVCWEEEAAVRSRRGSYWQGTFLYGAGAVRGWVRGVAKPRYANFPTPLAVVGFRCAYSSPLVAP